MGNKLCVPALKKADVMELVALAKKLGFRAFCTPYMLRGRNIQDTANFSVDWSSYTGEPGGKVSAIKAIKTACNAAKRYYFDAQEVR